MKQRIGSARMLNTSCNDIYKPTLQVTLIFRRDLSDMEFLGYAWHIAMQLCWDH